MYNTKKTRISLPNKLYDNLEKEKQREGRKKLRLSTYIYLARHLPPPTDVVRSSNSRNLSTPDGLLHLFRVMSPNDP